MSSNLSAFIKSLDALKRNYTCGVCSQFCKDPITLSKCFHIICSEHFKGLQTCPECGQSLEGCKTFVDLNWPASIECAKKLCDIFEKFREPAPKHESTSTVGKKGDKAGKKDGKAGKKEGKAGKKKTKTESINEVSEKVSSSKDLPLKVDNKLSRHKKDLINEDTSPKEEKSEPKQVELDTEIKQKLIVTRRSSSVKINKLAEKRNNKGETALHIACRVGKIEKVNVLLKQGVNTNTKDNAGWTPLHEVVQNGQLDLVKLLLQYNTLINVPGPNNETPLHEAVRYNHNNIAEVLVRNGADVNARNCKGETPMQLALPEMKAVLEKAVDEIIQTQSMNITHMSVLYSELDFDDIRVHCVSEFRTVHIKLRNLEKHHANFHIEQKWSKNVTHLIVDTEDDMVCQSSTDVLQGIVRGIWILSTKWLTESMEDKLKPLSDYEVTGVGTKTCKGPKTARYNKYKQHPGLFNGCHFYFHNFPAKFEVTKRLVLKKSFLGELVMDGGGVVLKRVPNPESIPDCEKLVPYHASKDGKLSICSHYIIYKDIYQPMYNMQHLKALPIGWLIECIEKYELCEPWLVV